MALEADGATLGLGLEIKSTTCIYPECIEYDV